MWKRYNAFLRKAPELTVQWRDEETGARAWLVINSLRGGAAGGGTRMRPGISPREVVYLAKAMDLKFSLSGPAIGGAKTGIDFDPTDPRKAEVLERWYRAIIPYLRHHYGTGGDLNVDEVLEVIPTFQRLGLHHPQEGVVRGHLAPDAARFDRIIRNLKDGVEAAVPDARGLAGTPMTVSDLITGFGVARSVEHFYARCGRSLEGVPVLLEGFGNVGAACGVYLARAGARIVGITDARSALVAPEGLGAAEVEDLMRRRVNKLLPVDPRTLPPAERDRFDDTRAEVFICAAVSGSLTTSRLERLSAAGVKVIASGANQPFREFRLGSTRVAQRADRRFTVLADILANCGMARTFSYLMEDGAHPDAEAIFTAVDRTIGDALDEVLDRNGNRVRGLLAATLGLGLDRVGAP
ncbi:MAG TPA: Glu/Leu/Phe/Val dehydrogenase dimerization domain-containing protein [Longimicrobiales bacterium]